MTVQKNILGQRPILMGSKVRIRNGKKYVGHAVTIIGYTTYGGINQITFYNPGSDSCTSVEYKNSGTTYSYANYKLKWVETIRGK